VRNPDLEKLCCYVDERGWLDQTVTSYHKLVKYDRVVLGVNNAGTVASAEELADPSRDLGGTIIRYLPAVNLELVLSKVRGV
jgi:hypothetical protein